MRTWLTGSKRLLLFAEGLPAGYVHHSFIGINRSCLQSMLNLPSKHSTLLKIQVTHRRPIFSPVPQLRKVVNKKEITWLFSCTYLMPVWLCPYRCHVQVQITAHGQMSSGGCQAVLMVQGLFGTLVPNSWLPLPFDGDLAASSSSFWFPRFWSCAASHWSYCFHHP